VARPIDKSAISKPVFFKRLEISGPPRHPAERGLVSEIDAPLPTRLRALARELVRLQPSRRDPEAYFAKKSEIVEGLRRAAREVDWTRPPSRSIVRPMVEAAPPVFRPPKDEPIASAGSCRHCRRRRSQHSYRHRLRLPTGDLFTWAGIEGR
jgi:hypothetical protein